MSNLLGGCHDAREMKSFEEVACPMCHTQASIELVLKDGYTVGESVCDECGYTIEGGTPEENIVYGDR